VIDFTGIRKMKMRILIIALLLSAVSPVLFGADSPVRVSAKPMEFTVGRTTRVSIILTRRPAKNGFGLPKIPGAEWRTDRIGRSQSFSIVNGRSSRSETYTVPLAVFEPGELVIPPIEVRFADGTTARSAPLKLRVLERGAAAGQAAEAEPEGRMNTAGKRSVFYVGEGIPLELELAIPERMRLRELGAPYLECAGPLVMPDYRKSGAKHPHYLGPVESTRIDDRGGWNTLKFTTRPRFMAPGEFTLSATEPLSVLVMPGGDDDMNDPFAFGHFGFSEPRHMQVKYPEMKLKILPVPPPPEGTHPLGMGPDADVAADFSAATVRKGEPLELRIRLPGVAPSVEITPPKLEFKDFRVFPPEVKTSPDGVRSVVYVLVPLVPGEHKAAAKFAIFDTVAGKWKTAEAEGLIAVASSAPEDQEKPGAAPTGDSADTAPRLPTVPGPGSDVSLPLARRGMVAGAAVFGILALAALAIGAARRWHEYRRSPAAVRRRAVNKLIRRVEDGESIDRIMRDGAMTLLAESLGLPEDSTPDAVAERLDDGELKDALAQLDRNTFAPEEARRESVVSPRARQELVRLLKRTLVPILLLAAFAAAAAEPPENPRNAVGCYNAGVEHLRLGKLPQARLDMERAHRLAPRDRRFRRGLDAAEIELGVPTSSRNIREYFRPDEYLIFAGAMFGGALVAFALRRFRKNAASAAAVVMAMLGIAAVVLAYTQYLDGGPYRTDRAIVTARNAELSSLPGEHCGHAVGALKGGTPASIVEERGGFILIRGDGMEGWCRKNDVERIFPVR